MEMRIERMMDAGCMHYSFPALTDVRRSLQWILVERVLDELMDAADQEGLEVTVQFAQAALRRQECSCQMSILLETDTASLAFIEDTLGNAWLAHWPQSIGTGQVRRISPSDDVGLLTRACIEALSDQSRFSLDKPRHH